MAEPERGTEDLEEEEEPKSSADIEVDRMLERLDGALADEAELLDRVDRTSLQLRRNLRRRRVDSAPKLRAVLATDPPPAAATKG